MNIETEIEILKQQINNLSKTIAILKEENKQIKKQLTEALDKIELADIGNCNYICNILVKNNGYIAPESKLTYDAQQKCLIFK